MTPLAKAIALAALAAVAVGAAAQPVAAKRTVCTITVNSADEKDAFRKYLPDDQNQFVELVERGRPDWLASACQQGVRCDVLIISGHFDGSTVFYSDKVAASEFLPVAEMERASCSNSCPGLFSQLKEVYLFGCNSLNADAIKSVSSEVGRSLVRAGHSPADAQRLARTLDQRHGESSRDRMRRIFMNVPVVYGFSSVAPLGPTAGTLLGRYLHSSTAEVGSGRVSQRLLGHFATESMIAVSGLSSAEPGAVYRQEACQFVDDRVSPADKLRFIHVLLRRDMGEVRMFLERIEALFASLSEAERGTGEFIQAQGEIAGDELARERYLRFAEDADAPQVRARMILLAGTLGWLSPPEQREALVRMFAELLGRPTIGAAEVDLICSLNADLALDQERDRLSLSLSPAMADRPTHAAALACLGSVEARARVLQALTSPNDADVQIAEVYLRHRPITDAGELRAVAGGIARMPGSSAQVRALDTLARHRLSDRESLEELARLFPAAQTLDVQRAIAAVFIRSDYRLLARPEMVRVLSESRRKAPGGDDIIDILIRRLQAP